MSFFGYPSASLGMQIAVLTPAYISTGIETAYFKNGSGVPSASTRDADLGLIVDCAVEWQPGNDRWVALHQVNGNQAAYTNPRIVWNVTVQASGPYTDDFFLSGTPSHSPGGNYGISFPTSSALTLDSSTTFNVSVHDYDDENNAVMTNSYKIRWHYPYENWVQTQEPEDDHDIVRPTECDPSNIPNNEGAVATMVKPPALWGISKNALALFGTQLSDPRAKLLAKLLEISAEEMTPSPTNRYPQFDPCWESSWSRWVHPNGIGYGFPPPTPSGKTLDQWQSEFYMHAKFVVGTRYYYERADKYGSHGFEGRSDFVVKRIFSDTAAGDYYPYTGNGGGGNPNDPPLGGL